MRYLFFLLSLLLALPGFTQSHKALFQTGQEYYEKGEYDKAIEYFSQAISKNKAKLPPSRAKQVTYTNWRGTSFCRVGKYNEAVKDLTFAINNRISLEINENSQPEWMPAKSNSDYYWRGYAHYNLKNYLLALDDFNVSVTLASNPGWDYYYKGLCLYELDRFQEAIKAFNQAIVANNESPSVYEAKGRTYYKLKEYQESHANYQRAFDKNPENISNLAAQAMPLAYMGQLDKSLSLLQESIEKDPDLQSYYYFMQARVYGIFGKRNEGIQSMETAFDNGFDNWNSLSLYFEDFGDLGSDPRFLQLLIENNAMVGVMESSSNKELLANLTSQKARNVSYQDIVMNEQNAPVIKMGVVPDTYKGYENKFALVIGNGRYKESPLKNPANDALLIASELKQSGFEVSEHFDLSKTDMKKAIRDFGEEIRTKEGVALFFYAGHGLQSGGSNFLVPVDADIKYDYEIEDACVNVNQVLRMMQEFNSKMNIIILDACRNNPFGSATRSAGQKGLAKPAVAPTGTIIAFATAPGKTASDGNGSNGLYTQQLVQAMRMPGLSIEEVFKEVRINVLRLSNDQQSPWENSSLIGDFYFRR